MIDKKSYMKKWHAEHSEQEKAYRDQYKEREKELRIARYWRNIEESREKQRKEYEKNINLKKEYQKKYIGTHHELVLSRIRDKRRAAKMDAFKSLGGKCVMCGFDDHRALQIDHVNSDGAVMRKSGETPGSQKFYTLVKMSVERGENVYQLLCCNCNWIKRFEMKEHNQYTTAVS